MRSHERTQRRGNCEGQQEVVDRQEAGDLVDKPGFGLVLLTRWTMSIAARASDRVFPVTVLAAIDDPTEFAGSTARDHRQHLAVFERNAPAELGQIRGTIPP